MRAGRAPAILLLGAMGALSVYYLLVHGAAVSGAWGAFLRVGAGLLLLGQCLLPGAGCLGLPPAG